MSTEHTLLKALIDELSLRANRSARDPRACQQLAGDLQKVLGMTSQEVIELLQKSYGYVQEGDYIEKAKDDPSEGVMRRLPLVDALARISVHIVERSDVRGLRLQCLRCYAQWDVDAYEGGDLNRPAGKYWMRCPAGCNMTAPWLWDKNEPPSFNPLYGYK